MTKILLVDDSDTQLYSLRKVLEDAGHDVVTAADGQEGVEKAGSETPDLILMDVVMPGLNGFQATRKIRRNPATKDIPVIFVTTKDQETDRIWGMRQGAAAYITKPVDKQALLAAINETLETNP
ncbi:MAG: response regulator [Wenzhouxiangella sp.]|nr:MAG: response regulator [Wenzhouxiangella sp.]